MFSRAKLIKTIYLYLVAAVSLVFVAVGTGNILNTALKAYVFPKAEKGGFSRCNEQPPAYGLEGGIYKDMATVDQKVQLENILRDYEEWKKNNTGEECYIQERQNNIVNAITMIIIATPILWIHWRLIKKEKEEKEVGKE